MVSVQVRWLLVVVLILGLGSPHVYAQEGTPPPKSIRKAFALSVLVPGLGHRYAHDGSWNGAASVFLGVDVGTWLGLAGTTWRQNQIVDSYRTLAASRAGAIVEGKGRAFFLNLASYRSSEEYLEVHLRNRAWDQIEYVSDRSYQWEWAKEEDFIRFRDQREQAESLRRRRTFLISLLVANRLLSGITAIRAVNRANADRSEGASFSLAMPPPQARAPLVQFRWRW